MSDNFIIVGENIHATRVFRSGGKRVVKTDDGFEAVSYKKDSGEKKLMKETD